MCVCVSYLWTGRGTDAESVGFCLTVRRPTVPHLFLYLPIDLSPAPQAHVAAFPIRVMYIRVMYGPVTDLWALRTFVISDSACIDPGLASIQGWLACGLGAWTDAAQSDGARGHRAHPATGSGGAGQLGRRLPARPACRDRARVGAGLRQSQQCHQQRREWWRRRCVRRCRS
jgi:hypothetical protein